MISASLRENAQPGVFKDLVNHAALLGEERGKRVKHALNSADHRWRSAAALWPDLGLE